MYIQIKTTDAIEFAGTKSKLAEFLGITRQSLTSWGDELPQSSAQKLFILTAGELGTKINEDPKRTSITTQRKTKRNTMFYP